jgi:hypothetical protein
MDKPAPGLELERFPVETGSLAVYEEDPHYPDVKSYLVLGNFFVTAAGQTAAGPQFQNLGRTQ